MFKNIALAFIDTLHLFNLIEITLTVTIHHPRSDILTHDGVKVRRVGERAVSHANVC